MITKFNIVQKVALTIGLGLPLIIAGQTSVVLTFAVLTVYAVVYQIATGEFETSKRK